jgi:hypothetical protein
VGAAATAVCGKASSLLPRFGVKTRWKLCKLFNRHHVDGFAVGKNFAGHFTQNVI